MSAAASYAYPQAGTFTSSWNGSGTLADSLTSGGQVVTSHAGVVLASLACPPPGVTGTANNASGTPTYAAVPV